MPDKLIRENGRFIQRVEKPSGSEQETASGLILSGKQQVQENDSSGGVAAGRLIRDEVEVKRLELIQSGGWMKVAAQSRLLLWGWDQKRTLKSQWSQDLVMSLTRNLTEGRRTR